MSSSDCGQNLGANMATHSVAMCHDFFDNLETTAVDTEKERQYCADMLDKNNDWLCHHECGIETNDRGIRQCVCSTCDAQPGFIILIGFVVACIAFVIIRNCCYPKDKRDDDWRGSEPPGPIPAMAYNISQQPAANPDYQLQVAIALSTSEAEAMNSSETLPVARVVPTPQLEAELSRPVTPDSAPDYAATSEV
jgi:hypothetical protein